MPPFSSSPILPRPEHPRRGLLRIAAFFALLGAAAVGLDRVIDRGLGKITTSKFGSLNRVTTGRVNAAIVVNGSSRALAHYDPRILREATGRSVYNLGMNGNHSDVQLAVLKAYLNHNRAPALVIQNLEAFSFEATRVGQIHDPGVFLPYLSDPDLYGALRAIDPVVWKWKHLPLYGYVVEDLRFTWIAGLLGHAGVSGREDYHEGFSPLPGPWTGDFERFRATVPDGVRYGIEPDGLRALTGIIELCRSRQIALILVYSPEYVGMQALERNRAQIFARFAALSAQFLVPFWDFSDSPLSRDRANFHNSEHLNAAGATAFSQELGRRLVADSPLSARKGPAPIPAAAPAELSRL